MSNIQNKITGWITFHESWYAAPHLHSRDCLIGEESLHKMESPFQASSTAYKLSDLIHHQLFDIKYWAPSQSHQYHIFIARRIERFKNEQGDNSPPTHGVQRQSSSRRCLNFFCSLITYHWWVCGFRRTTSFLFIYRWACFNNICGFCTNPSNFRSMVPVQLPFCPLFW